MRWDVLQMMMTPEADALDYEVAVADTVASPVADEDVEAG